MMRQRSGRVVRTGNKLRQWAKTPGCGRADDMQTGDRGLQTFAETRIAIDLLNGFQELWGKELIPRDIDTISGSKKYVIDDPLAPVVQPDFDSIPRGTTGRDGAAKLDGNNSKPVHQPARAGRPDGAHP